MGKKRFSLEEQEGQIGLLEDLSGVSEVTGGFADEGSKLIENKDFLFKHRIKNSVFFYFVFKL